MSQHISATARYLRVTPRKLRAVADLIKGLSVNEAEAQLMLQPRRAAKPLLKLLRSASSNAKNNAQEKGVEAFFVKNVLVDKGPMLKRMLPRARGSASPIHKVMSHATIILEKPKIAKPVRFTILVPKKEKKDSSSSKNRAKKRVISPQVQEGAREKQSPNPGLLRRVFRRKAAGGE